MVEPEIFELLIVPTNKNSFTEYHRKSNCRKKNLKQIYIASNQNAKKKQQQKSFYEKKNTEKKSKLRSGEIRERKREREM